jgi:DNA-directed RNA polymerase subunit RPC12/RpoP
MTESATMHCPSCQSDLKPGEEVCGSCGHPLPKSVTAPTAAGTEKGWGEGQKSWKCDGCGAEIVYNKTQLKFTCAYCGSEKVLEQAPADSGHEDDVRPDRMVPFRIKKPQADDLFHRWVAGLWFAPNDLKQLAAGEKIRGVYLPFWSYDCDTHTWYTARVGHDYQETEHYTEEENGHTVHRTRTVTHTRWSHTKGWVESSYKDVLVVSSKNVDRTLVLELEPFHVKQAVPFSTEQLTGWEAERYALDHEEAWDKYGKARVVEKEVVRASEDARTTTGADHVDSVEVHVRFPQLLSEHLLLPIYVSGFRYADKTYRFMINGQTGEVHGQRPYSWIKITLLVLAIVALIAAIVFFVQYQSSSSPR